MGNDNSRKLHGDSFRHKVLPSLSMTCFIKSSSGTVSTRCEEAWIRMLLGASCVAVRAPALCQWSCCVPGAETEPHFLLLCSVRATRRNLNSAYTRHHYACKTAAAVVLQTRDPHTSASHGFQGSLNLMTKSWQDVEACIHLSSPQMWYFNLCATSDLRI